MVCVGDLLRWKLAACAYSSGTASSSGSGGLRRGSEASVGPRPRVPHGGGQGASQKRAIVTSTTHRRDSDTPMVPLLFDCPILVIHGARLGLDFSQPASGGNIQQHRPAKAVIIHRAALSLNPLILASNLRNAFGALPLNILGHAASRDPCCSRTISGLALSRSLGLECTMRKLRKSLDRGLRSVRTSAKAACQRAPRAN